ncbi:MAG: hypothetical protein PHY48_16710 [Candidatus Cloacimonetes bacterium]|nr:hypothetical protein [Candidatus Cloacimonadota bacterium]
MSHKFIQGGCYPVKDKTDKYEVTTDEKVSTNTRVAMLIPAIEGNYYKGAFECTVNLMEDMSQTLRYNMKADGKKTEQDLDEELTRIVKGLAATMQYLVNSTSWRTGEMQGFDKAELKLKIGRLM